MIKYLISILCLLPALCWGQPFPLPADTVYLLFDVQSLDSCSYTYVDVNIPKEAFIKKYRKELFKDKKGKVKQITFHICEEEFIYQPRRHKSDTLAGTSLKGIKFLTIQEAKRTVQQIEDSLNAEAAKTKVLYAYPKYRLVNIVIIEKVVDQKLVTYPTEWVEQIE